MLLKDNKNNNRITVCYFGIYKPTMARNKVYLNGLKENGAEIIECIDSSRSFVKFWHLVVKHWRIRKQYDILFVGYLSNLVVPLAKIISGKKIIYNALNSMYEGVVLDREIYGKYSPMKIYFWLVDFLALHSADLVLVESNEQKKFITEKFKIKENKMAVIYTGADNQIFFPDQKIKKRERFTIVFRGKFLPATGVEYVIKAAKVLQERHHSGADMINFLIIGRGLLEKKIRKMIKDFNLKNIELITEYLSSNELRRKMLSCHICLGQFADHPRMNRTIQNKTFEALALGMPYITRDSASNRELLKDKENCLFVKPANPEDLADKILELKNNSELREKIAKKGHDLYKEKLNQKVLGKNFLKIITEREDLN